MNLKKICVASLDEPYEEYECEEFEEILLVKLGQNFFSGLGMSLQHCTIHVCAKKLNPTFSQTQCLDNTSSSEQILTHMGV